MPRRGDLAEVVGKKVYDQNREKLPDARNFVNGEILDNVTSGMPSVSGRKRLLLIFSARIFDSSVERGIPGIPTRLLTPGPGSDVVVFQNEASALPALQDKYPTLKPEGSSTFVVLMSQLISCISLSWRPCVRSV